MNKLKKIQYNCKQATFLIEKRQITRLTFREAIELRIHMAGCSVCRIFDKQSHIINALVKQLLHDSNDHDIRLDEQYKQQMHAKIEDELNKK